MSGGLSDLSDADLLKALGQGAQQPAGPDLSGLSDADLMKQLGQPMPAPVAAAPTRSWGDTAADVGRSVLSGLDKGVAGIAGAPADLLGVAIRGKDWADARLSGQNADALTAERDAKATIQPGALAKYGSDAFHQGSGLAHEPETTAGKYADTVASFAPGALLGPGSLMRRFALGAGVPGLASEAAGQATAGTAAEPFARVGAALASPALASRAITPLGIPAARAPLVATLDHEGVPISAGQRTGSGALQNIEAVLGDTPGAGGAARRMTEQTQQGLNRAVSRRFGEEADLLTPDVMQGASRRIGGVFDEVQNRNALQFDPQMGRDMADTIARYGRKLPSQQREPFGNVVQDIRDQVIAGGGSIPGPVYQQARSDLTKIVQGARTSDPAYSGAMGGIRDALDSAFERSIAGTPDAGRLAEARQQYGAMKTAEKAVGGAGVEAAQGNISPAGLRSAVAGQNREAYVRGQGDLADLSRAATAVAPLPNSGTAPRLMANGVVHSLGAMGAGLMLGAPTATAAGTGAAALVLPALAGRAIMSRPMQAYLGNNVIAPEAGGMMSRFLRGVQSYEDSRGADPLQLRARSR